LTILDFLISHPPHQILATPLRTGLPGLRKRDTRFAADMVWPISTLLKADMVFCVADMVVADVVSGRYRRFPSLIPECPDRSGMTVQRDEDTY